MFFNPLTCYYVQEAAEFDCLYDLTGLFFNAVTGQCDWAAKTVCFSPEVSLTRIVASTDQVKLV